MNYLSRQRGLCLLIQVSLSFILFVTSAVVRAQSAIAAEEWAKLDRAYPLWKTIVGSQSYIHWFERQHTEIRELAESRTADGAIRVLNTFQKFRIDSQQSGTFKLNCSIQTASGSANAYKTDEIYWVDTLTGKVSGYSASISEDYIEFVVSTQYPQRAVINRQSGLIQIGDAKFPLLAQGTCVKAGPRQF